MLALCLDDPATRATLVVVSMVVVCMVMVPVVSRMMAGFFFLL